MKLVLLIAMLLAVPSVAAAEAPDQPQRPRKAMKLRRALIHQFDANGDGKLGPRERMRAVRVLRRMADRLEQRAAAQQPRRPRMQPEQVPAPEEHDVP